MRRLKGYAKNLVHAAVVDVLLHRSGRTENAEAGAINKGKDPAQRWLLARHRVHRLLQTLTVLKEPGVVLEAWSKVGCYAGRKAVDG